MKFASEDAAYLSKRRVLSQELGPRELWSVIDHWPLYCGVANLARFMAIADILGKYPQSPRTCSGIWVVERRQFDVHGQAAAHL